MTLKFWHGENILPCLLAVTMEKNVKLQILQITAVEDVCQLLTILWFGTNIMSYEELHLLEKPVAQFAHVYCLGTGNTT